MNKTIYMWISCDCKYLYILYNETSWYSDE